MKLKNHENEKILSDKKKDIEKHKNSTNIKRIWVLIKLT